MSLQLKVAEKLVEPLEVRCFFLSRGLVVASRGQHYYAVFMSPEESSTYQSHIYFRLSSLLLVYRVPVVLTKWQYYIICR